MNCAMYTTPSPLLPCSTLIYPLFLSQGDGHTGDKPWPADEGHRRRDVCRAGYPSDQGARGAAGGCSLHYTILSPIPYTLYTLYPIETGVWSVQVQSKILTEAETQLYSLVITAVDGSTVSDGPTTPVSITTESFSYCPSSYELVSGHTNLVKTTEIEAALFARVEAGWRAGECRVTFTYPPIPAYVPYNPPPLSPISLLSPIPLPYTPLYLPLYLLYLLYLLYFLYN